MATIYPTVCLLSLGTDRYQKGGLQAVKKWSTENSMDVTFIELDSLEEINTGVFGNDSRPSGFFSSVLNESFSGKNHNLLYASNIEKCKEYKKYHDLITSLVRDNSSLRNQIYSQTYKSLHRSLASVGVNNQRHSLVRYLSEYLIKELSLLLFLKLQHGVKREVTLHNSLPIREKLHDLMSDMSLKFPEVVKLEAEKGLKQLELQSLVVDIAKGEKTIGPIDLVVRPGSILGIMGPNGVGKSTLLKTVAGHLKPVSGKIVLENIDVTKFSPLEKCAASVFQDSALIDDFSLEKNLNVGDKLGKIRSDNDFFFPSQNILNTFGITHRSQTKALHLSGGEKQIGAIARAVSSNPKVLLMDEPFASMDQQRTQKALCLLREFVQSTKIIGLLVSHDPNVINSMCDEVVIFSNKGNCIEQGRLGKVLEECKSIEAAELLAIPNIFTCKPRDSKSVFISDLGVSAIIPNSIPSSYVKGVQIPETCIRLVAPNENISTKDEIEVNGRVKFCTKNLDGISLMFQPDSSHSGTYRNSSLGRWVMLKIKLPDIKLYKSTKVKFAILKSSLRWLGN